MGALLSAVYGAKCEDERLAGRVTWPSGVYANDFAGFCRRELGFAATAKQVEVGDSVRDHDRTALVASRKAGKSRCLAALAMQHYCQYDDATVVIVAPCERQITEIVWYDLVSLYHASGRCLSCRLRDPNGPRPCGHATSIDGDLSASVRTGLRCGQRRIIGLAPRNAHNARGISGPHQLWLFDESPGVSREIYEAADGNRAGGAKLVVAGNPTSRATWFYDACQTFHVVHIACSDSPNVRFGRRIVPGLADIPWLEEKRLEWGEDDPRFQTECMGIFPTREADRLVSDLELAACFERHETIDLNAVLGDLSIGIDPAGGRGGDKSAIVVRRGWVVLEMRAFNGATDSIMLEVDLLLRKWRKWPKEPVWVNFDGSSSFGAEMAKAFQDLQSKDTALECRALEMKGHWETSPVLRESRCARLIDAYYMNLSHRLRASAAIPFDETLRVELLFAEWRKDQERAEAKLISKREYRKRLGRSPDLSDALAFAFWEGRVAPASTAAAEYDRNMAEAPPALEAPPPDIYNDRTWSGGGMSPYHNEFSPSAGRRGGGGEDDDA